MSGFSDPILAGDGNLLRIVEKSRNYQAGVSGWAIFQDGSAEFNSGTFRGSIIVGTTTGKRIEINVVLGSIQMFDATNAVVADWSSSAGRFIVYKAGTSQTAYVSLDTTFAQPAVLLQANSAKYTTAATVFHSDGLGDGGIPTLTLDSGRAAGRSHAFININGQSTTAGTTPSQIQLDATTVLAPSGMSHAVGNVTASITASPIAIAPGTTQVIVTITPTCVAGRSYEITGRWQGINIGVPAAYPGNRVTMSIKRGGVSIAAKRILAGAASGFTQEGGTISVTDTPGAGVITYTLEMNHETASTAGTSQVNATATAPAELYIRGFA